MAELKKPDYTTIRIPKELRDRLQAAGHKGQSYAEIINALLERKK